MADILLVSDGFFHPPRAARYALRDMLAAIPGIQLTQIRHLNFLVSLEMNRFRALVLYFHHRRLTPFRMKTFTVKDELYLHNLQPDITVHFTAMHEGAAQPVVWARMEGSGSGVGSGG